MVSAISQSVREVDQLVVQGLGYLMVYMAGWAVWQCLCTGRIYIHMHRTTLKATTQVAVGTATIAHGRGAGQFKGVLKTHV